MDSKSPCFVIVVSCTATFLTVLFWHALTFKFLTSYFRNDDPEIDLQNYLKTEQEYLIAILLKQLITAMTVVCVTLTVSSILFLIYFARALSCYKKPPSEQELEIQNHPTIIKSLRQ